jgi:dTDP-4-dehydrorhamnose 3,5-epimerase
MKVDHTPIEDLLVLTPDIYSDARGSFCELWKEDTLAVLLGERVRFVQDNISWSCRGTLRGLHFQESPYAQGKLVFVPQGAVFDVALDIRRESRTFGHHFHVELSETNKRMLWIPPGFAHGFLVLTDSATVLYKATCHYAPSHEKSVHWRDPELRIPWPLAQGVAPVVSPKDDAAPRFGDLYPASKVALSDFGNDIA